MVGSPTSYYTHLMNAQRLQHLAEWGICQLCALIWNGVPAATRIEVCRPFEIEGAVVDRRCRYMYQTTYNISSLEHVNESWNLLYQIPLPNESINPEDGKPHFGPVERIAELNLSLLPLSSKVSPTSLPRPLDLRLTLRCMCGAT